MTQKKFEQMGAHMYNFIHKSDYSCAGDIEVSYNLLPFYMITNFIVSKGRMKFTIFVQDRHNDQIFQFAKTYVKKYYHVYLKFHDAQNCFYSNKKIRKNLDEESQKKIRKNPESEDVVEPPAKRQKTVCEQIFESNFCKYTDPYTLVS